MRISSLPFRARRTVAMLSALLMLSACQIGTKITVSYVNKIPIFIVTRQDGDQTCVESIDVAEGRGEIGSAVSWVIRQKFATGRSDKDICQNVFIYGTLIDDFEQEVQAKPLTPGASYTVSIGGAGLTGSTYFTVPR